MGFENLLSNYDKLIRHMEDNGYAKSYILYGKTVLFYRQILCLKGIFPMKRRCFP